MGKQAKLLYFFLRNTAYTNKLATSLISLLQDHGHNRLKYHNVLIHEANYFTDTAFFQKQIFQALKETEADDIELGLLTTTTYPKVTW